MRITAKSILCGAALIAMLGMIEGCASDTPSMTESSSRTMKVGASTSIDELTVKNLILKTDAAKTPKEMEDLAPLLSDDFEYVSMLGDSELIHFTKTKFIEFQKSAVALITDSTSERTFSKIEIHGDQVYVLSNLKASVTMMGMTQSTEANEEISLKLIDGSLKITKWISHTDHM